MARPVLEDDRVISRKRTNRPNRVDGSKSDANNIRNKIVNRIMIALFQMTDQALSTW